MGQIAFHESPTFRRELLRQLGKLYLTGVISSGLLRALRNLPLARSGQPSTGYPIGSLLPTSYRADELDRFRASLPLSGRPLEPAALTLRSRYQLPDDSFLVYRSFGVSRSDILPSPGWHYCLARRS